MKRCFLLERSTKAVGTESETVIATLRIYLFGKFCVERNGYTVAGLEARRVQNLLCYLLLNRQYRCSREVLANLFWGDSSVEQSKKNLRQILWQLLAALDEVREPQTEALLHVHLQWLQINPQADFWLDVDFFEQSWQKVKLIPGKELSTTEEQTLRNVIALYQGNLLEDNYEDWCLRERARLQDIYLAMLDKLMEYSETQRRYETGLDYGARILLVDQAHERTHRQLMRLYYLLGDRTAALRQYQRCETALQEELGVSPGKLTQLLHQQIIADHVGNSPPTAEAPAHVHEHELALSLSHVLTELKQIQAAQANLQHQVQQYIRTIERNLGVLSDTPEIFQTLVPEQKTFRR